MNHQGTKTPRKTEEGLRKVIRLSSLSSLSAFVPWWFTFLTCFSSVLKALLEFHVSSQFGS
jgi:hypothetical protein